MKNAQEFIIGSMQVTNASGQAVAKKDLKTDAEKYQHQNKYSYEKPGDSGKQKKY